MFWAICIFVLFSTYVELSIQKEHRFSSLRTMVKLLESKYDILEAEFIGMNQDIETIWETVNVTRKIPELDVVISEGTTAEHNSSKPARTMTRGMESMTSSRTLDAKINRIEKGVRDEKQATRKRLDEFETKFQTELNTYGDTVSEMERKHRDILENIKEIDEQLPEKDAIAKQIAIHMAAVVGDIRNLTDKFTILSERYETTVSEQANEINNLNAKYNELMTEFVSYVNMTGKQPISPDILKQSDWKQFGSSMYKRFTVELNWMDAMEMCKLSSAGHGYLAEIYSRAEKNFVTNMMYDEYWLGGCQIRRRGEFRWCGTDSVINYSSWKRGEPNGDSENCLHAFSYRDGHKGEWNDCHCYDRRPFVCEIPIPN